MLTLFKWKRKTSHLLSAGHLFFSLPQGVFILNSKYLGAWQLFAPISFFSLDVTVSHV